MDRYLLLVIWGEGKFPSTASEEAEHGPKVSSVDGTEKQPDFTAANVYHLLKRSISASINPDDSTFPACSVGGVPGSRKWCFAVQAVCGFYQFCSSDWQEIHFDEDSKIEDVLQASIEDCLSAVESVEEEDTSSGESLSLAELYEESAENLHQLSDKLPAPGRAMIDTVLLSPGGEAPKLTDCLPAVGALKRLCAWHAAKVTVVGNHWEASCQKIAEYLSANVVSLEELRNVIDPKELWRGRIQIWERKFGFEVSFPEFCLKGVTPKNFSTSALNTCFLAKKITPSKDKDILPKVFHYYGPALQFVQMIKLSDLPSCYVSDIEFELGLTENNSRRNSTLLLEQISSLCGKVGALFALPCTVSNVLLPPPTQLSSRKWKEYIAKRPETVTAPEVAVKGERAAYYLLVRGGGGGAGARAALLHSASQINGALALSVLHGAMRAGTPHTEPRCPFDLEALPHFSGEQLVQREDRLAAAQALVLKECLERTKLAKEPEAFSADELKSLLRLTRERFLHRFDAHTSKMVLRQIDKIKTSAMLNAQVFVSTAHAYLPSPVLVKPGIVLGTRGGVCPKILIKPMKETRVVLSLCRTPTGCHLEHGSSPASSVEPDSSSLMETSSSEWPEKHVLQNLETFEKAREKVRPASFPRSSEPLLGQQEAPRDVVPLDARELLKHFTSDGLPAGELQPLPVHRGDKTFVLTPELSPRKLRVLPFEKALVCHYHGIEYCLDDQKALDRDGGFSELQSRLIRYETHTTCTRDGFPGPALLSPIPAPAGPDEPGSGAAGEAPQSERGPPASRLKRRSGELSCLRVPKRRVKSDSSDSLPSQPTGSRGRPCAVASGKPQPERNSDATRPSLPGSCSKAPKAVQKAGAGQKSVHESNTSVQTKESRSQKHTRILRDVVAASLKRHRISEAHECFPACSQRLFEISKCYLKDLKTSRGLFEEMKKTANNNVVQVIEWVLEKRSKK